MLCPNINDIAIISVKNVECCCIIHDMIEGCGYIQKFIAKKSILEVESTTISFTI